MQSNQTYSENQNDEIISNSSKLVFVSLLIVIYVLSIIFNSLSISSVWHSKPFSTINLLIFNLSISDIVYSIGIPFFIVQILTKQLPFGSYGCRIFLCTEFCGITVSQLTITGLSVERFFDVADPKKRCDNFSNKFKILIIILYVFFSWLIALIFTIPFVMSVYSQQDGTMVTCQSLWSETSINIYFFMKFLFVFLIPYLIIIISSIKILLFLNKWKKRISKANEGSRKSIASLIIKSNSTFLHTISLSRLASNSVDTRLTDVSSIDNEKKLPKNSLRDPGHKNSYINGAYLTSVRKKAVRLVLAIIFVFLIQWFPFWIFQFAISFSSLNIKNVHLINLNVSTLSYSNTVLNPLIYMLLTYKFKSYFKNKCLNAQSNDEINL
ncbi:free fatty acid receptor 4-like [Brachionus plicatilis]|uniref:Free fatty acid receptor 4-like n=1 Tax=Brachionus plicatilis TaxID=10195 RepID=A0A3M7SL75_BRAPC|nr:free fatty acid receptor 4-like [Brachionus plicatilis]